MSFLTRLRRPKAKRPRLLPADRLAVYGRVRSGARLLARSDFEAMPAVDHTPDVAAYARGEHGQAFRFSALVDFVRPVPGTLYVSFESRDGRHRISHFLAEIQELGWISYGAAHAGHPLEQGGPFRLILPGIPAERGRMDDVAWIEFADEARACRIAGSDLVESSIERAFDPYSTAACRGPKEGGGPR